MNAFLRTLALSMLVTAAPFTLRCNGARAASVILHWTNTYDDNGDITSGPIYGYEIRMRTDGPVTAANWNTSTVVVTKTCATDTAWCAGLEPGGLPDSVLVSNLNPNTAYWFAIKIKDDANNWSALSNIFMYETPDIIAPAAITDLRAGS